MEQARPGTQQLADLLKSALRPVDRWDGTRPAEQTLAAEARSERWELTNQPCPVSDVSLAGSTLRMSGNHSIVRSILYMSETMHVDKSSCRNMMSGVLNYNSRNSVPDFSLLYLLQFCRQPC